MKKLPEFHNKYPKLIIDWVENQKWEDFTKIQKEAIKKISIKDFDILTDYILASETSSGKTEAIYLPLLAKILEKGNLNGSGYNILYISPLIALINDQYERIKPLAEYLNLNIIKWHSGVSPTLKKKAKLIRNGILLTTPESIEGFLLRSNQQDADIFKLCNVDAIILDEFHSYFENPRGRHLQSLLARIEKIAERKIPRFALSATLGDATEAAMHLLRPSFSKKPIVLNPTESKNKIAKIYLNVILDKRLDGDISDSDKVFERLIKEIGNDFYDLDRGLVFSNSRAGVELLYEKLLGEYNINIDENSFYRFARHYSNLKSTKSEVEKVMRAQYTNSKYDKLTTICTNTLELGIDIGKVSKVGQVDSTYSVAALRQRIGRSGRRTSSPEGIVYVIGQSNKENDHPLDILQLKTFQAAATINLAIQGQFESPTTNDLHLSTLVHQILSLIHEKKLITTDYAYGTLIINGPWDNNIINKRYFSRFLESLAESKYPLIESKTKNEWSFPKMNDDSKPRRPVYAVFRTPQEYSVVYRSSIIGQLPMTVQYHPGDTFILNGRRWKVLTVSETNRRLIVTQVMKAKAPHFGGSMQAPSGLIVKEMLKLYHGKKEFLGEVKNDTCISIQEGIKAFKKYNLDKDRVLTFGSDVLLFPFCGAKRMQTLLLLLRREGLRASIHGFALNIENTTKENVIDYLIKIRDNDPVELDELARESMQLCSDRYDKYLTPYHQRISYSHKYLDNKDLKELIHSLIGKHKK